MSFAEHAFDFPNDDGTYDLAAAEAAHAAELAKDAEALQRLAERAAHADRKAWETTNGSGLAKLLSQPALSPELDLEQPVPLGENAIIRYGDMDRPVIQRRKDFRTDRHMKENESFNTEMQHWKQTLDLLSPDAVIKDEIR
jgi:hypothetical protein